MIFNVRSVLGSAAARPLRDIIVFRRHVVQVYLSSLFCEYLGKGMYDEEEAENVKRPRDPEMPECRVPKKQRVVYNMGEGGGCGPCDAGGQVIRIESLFDRSKDPPARRCRFENVRLLCTSKLRVSVAQAYGSSKSSVAIYVGDVSGHTACVILHGISSIDAAWAYNPLVSICNMQCSGSHRGVLNIDPWEPQSIICEKSYAVFSKCEYPYRLQVCRQFSCMRFIRDHPCLNDYVSLAIYVFYIEEKQTGEQEPFLLIRGIDIEGQDCGKLRMWQHDMSDAPDAAGKVFMLRGMRVQYDRWWDHREQRYTTGSCALKVPTCCRLSAMEDVTDTVIAREFKRRRVCRGGS